MNFQVYEGGVSIQKRQGQLIYNLTNRTEQVYSKISADVLKRGAGEMQNCFFYLVAINHAGMDLDDLKWRRIRGKTIKPSEIDGLTKKINALEVVAGKISKLGFHEYPEDHKRVLDAFDSRLKIRWWGD